MAEIEKIQKIKIGSNGDEHPIDAVTLDGNPASTYQLVSNLVTSVNSSSSDSQYPSAKYIYDSLEKIREELSKI